MTSKMQIIGLLFLICHIHFLMNFYKILENISINIFPTIFSKSFMFKSFFFNVLKIFLSFFYIIFSIYD